MLDAGSNSMEPVTPPRHESGTWSDADGSPLPTPPRVSHVYDIKGDETWPTTPPTLRRRNQDEAAGNSVTCRPSTSRDVLQTPAISSLSRSLSVNTHAANQRSVGRGLQKLRTYSTYTNVRTYVRFFVFVFFFFSYLAGSGARSGSMHVPARRVQRYQDDEDVLTEEREAQAPMMQETKLLDSSSNFSDDHRHDEGAPRPVLMEMEHNHGSRSVSAPAAPLSTPATETQETRASTQDVDERACDFLELMLEEAERQHKTGFVPMHGSQQKPTAKETTFRGCRFIKERRAGEGGFSTVWQVRGPTAIPASVPGAETDAVRMEPVEETRQGFFAMKQVSLRRLEPESRDELVQEAKLLEQLSQMPDHEQYVLRYFGHRLNRDTLKIVRSFESDKT